MYFLQFDIIFFWRCTFIFLFFYSFRTPNSVPWHQDGGGRHAEMPVVAAENNPNLSHLLLTRSDSLRHVTQWTWIENLIRKSELEWKKTPKSCFKVKSNPFGFTFGKQLNNKNICFLKILFCLLNKFQQKGFSGFLKETFDKLCC